MWLSSNGGGLLWTRKWILTWKAENLLNSLATISLCRMELGHHLWTNMPGTLGVQKVSEIIRTLHSYILLSTICVVHYRLYSIHYTQCAILYALYALHYTLYTTHSTLYATLYTLRAIYYTLYTVHYTIYTIHYKLYAIHSTLQYTQYAIHCTLHSALYAMNFTIKTYTVHYTLH
jgi:hypothetical protein